MILSILILEIRILAERNTMRVTGIDTVLGMDGIELRLEGLDDGAQTTEMREGEPLCSVADVDVQTA